MKKREIAFILIAEFLFLLIVNLQKHQEIFLAIYGLLFVFLAIKNFRLTLLIGLALYPVMSRQLLLLDLPLFDLTFARGIVAIILIRFFFYRPKDGFSITTAKIFKLLMILLAFDFLASLLAQEGLVRNIKGSIAFSLDIVAFSFVYSSVFSQKDRDALFASVGIGVLILALCVLVEAGTSYNPLFSYIAKKEAYIQLQENIWMRAGVLRARGSFLGPVQFGGFTALMLFSSLYFLLQNRYRLFGCFLGSLSIASVYLSMSRTAWASCAVFVLTSGILLRTMLRYLLILGLVVFLVIMVHQEWAVRIYDFLINPAASEYEGGNIIGRAELFFEGIYFTFSSAPFGMGITDDQMFRMSVINPLFTDTANFYVAYGISKGMICLSIFLFFMVYMVREIYRRFKVARDPVLGILLSITITVFVGHLAYAEIQTTLPIVLIFYAIVSKDDRRKLYNS